MIKSMTAFARHTLESTNGNFTWEIRSVNHRYLEIVARLPDDFRYIESSVREQIARYAKRGKIDVTLKYQPPQTYAKSIELDQSIVQALENAGRDIRAVMVDAAPLSVADVLRWPGSLKTTEIEQAELSESALTSLDIALSELVETRLREGAQLKVTLIQRCDSIEEEMTALLEHLPNAISATRTRLCERIEELKVELDENRLEQEIALLVNKSDIAEELDRLRAHVNEVRRILESGQPMGRRLDFLMQELNREANTIGSKSVDTVITRASVELKVLVEQMREQVQNIE